MSFFFVFPSRLLWIPIVMPNPAVFSSSPGLLLHSRDVFAFDWLGIDRTHLLCLVRRVHTYPSYITCARFFFARKGVEGGSGKGREGRSVRCLSFFFFLRKLLLITL